MRINQTNKQLQNRKKKQEKKTKKEQNKRKEKKMSWGTCYSASNNIHFNSPPIMMDGRNFSSWKPESTINQQIRMDHNIHSNWSYRQYLTTNASDIMNLNRSEYCQELGLPTHFFSLQTPASNVPILMKSNFNTLSPGYGYFDSDLKNPYLSREQLEARLVAPNLIPSPSYSGLVESMNLYP